MSMEFGAWVGNNGMATPEHMASVAVAADTNGLASIWAADHIVWPVEYDSKYPYGGDKYPSDENQPVCECITTLSWLSAQTTRVKVGSLVIVVPHRNPWILGKELATLDVLNHGRTILGAGMGWMSEEFEVLQVPFKGRFKRGEESIALMRSMWREHPMTWDGPAFPSREVGVLPHPVQESIPVWLGGNTEPAQRRAGRLANGWIPYGVSATDYAVGLGAVRAAAEEAGRDPGEIVPAVWLPLTLTKEGDTSVPEAVYLQGHAAQLVERISEYARAGLEHLVMYNFCAPEATADQIQQISEEVMPHL